MFVEMSEPYSKDSHHGLHTVMALGMVHILYFSLLPLDNDVWPRATYRLVDKKLFKLDRPVSVLLLRALAVGRRQQSESIRAALDMD